MALPQTPAENIRNTHYNMLEEKSNWANSGRTAVLKTTGLEALGWNTPGLKNF